MAQKTCGSRKISWKWRFVHWRNWTLPDLSMVCLDNWFGIQTAIPSRSVTTERTWTHCHFPRRRFFECRERNTLILAFLQPGYSDIIKITAQGRASFRRVRNGEGVKSGGHNLWLFCLKVCIDPGIAKRPILLVLFFKEKYGISFEYDMKELLTY